MTKLIPQLSFSSSIYQGAAVDASPEPDVAKPTKTFEEGGALSAAAAGGKRSALSASDAECFSLCLGAGPLCCIKYCVCVSGGPDVPALGSAPPGGVRGGAASPLAAPRSPQHDDDSYDLLSALLCGTSLSGSAETLAPREHDLADPQPIIAKILERKERQPVKVDFKIYLTENTASYWEAVVHGSSMYLRLPGVLSSGSKESFMTLLDFAEERLGCSNCIVCVRKSRPDRATLLRTFMFMGFQLLAPTSPILPRELANPDYVFLHYNMQ